MRYADVVQQTKKAAVLSGAYYESDRAVLYCGDCAEVLPVLEADWHLIVTDPPYGVQWQGRYRKKLNQFSKIKGDDGSLDVPALIGLSLRNLHRGRHLYVFGKFDLSSLPLTEACEIIWDKQIQGLGDLTKPYSTSHENITFTVYEPSKANREGGSGGLTARLRKGSVIHCQRPNAAGVTRHPTEKPIDLLRQLIESSSILGETVLDPFSGSGSTLVAALLEGRKAIGIEIEEKYAEVAANRLVKVEKLLDRYTDL